MNEPIDICSLFPKKPASLQTYQETLMHELHPLAPVCRQLPAPDFLLLFHLQNAAR